MDRNSAKAYINSQSPDAFLQRAKKHGYVCPECNNGTGKDGDGIVKIPNSSKYKCFKCGLSGDIFDLIGFKYGITEFNDKFMKATEIYGVSIDKHSSSSLSSFEQGQHAARMIGEIAAVSPKEDVSAYIDKCHAAVVQTDYFVRRGISQESIERFRFGYDPEFREGTGGYTWKAVIIPTSSETYEARNIAVDPNSAVNGKNKYRRHGKTHLFNVAALWEEKEKPIIICEGVFDAVSIIQSGGQAIGLESAVNYKLLLEELKKVSPSVPLILAFDPDDTGKDNADKMATALDRQRISFMISHDLFGGCHDANDRLLKDPEGLKVAVEKAYMEAAKIPNPMDEAKDRYLETSAGMSLDAFAEAIKASAGRPVLSTGFRQIDDALDGGIYTGLYIIGAISSLGKTTLVLQIADNLAKQGRDVLFFSLEQSKYDLMSKAISRETYLHCLKNGIDSKNAKSNLGIMDGRRWMKFSEKEREVVSAAWKTYGEYARHIFITEGIGNISVEEIRDCVKEHISLTGNKRPIVFIDYLQILKAAYGDERASDKQIVDHNVTALKQLSRDFDIPIIAVSSLNRQNYSERINMAAFKESGAIEYGSDVLIGLQLTGAGEKEFDVDKAKEADPRAVDFCILKNRNYNTKTKGIPMKFFPVFNCFKEAGGIDGGDGFMPILEKDDEDNCPF